MAAVPGQRAPPARPAAAPGDPEAPSPHVPDRRAVRAGGGRVSLAARGLPERDHLPRGGHAGPLACTAARDRPRARRPGRGCRPLLLRSRGAGQRNSAGQGGLPPRGRTDPGPGDPGQDAAAGAQHRHWREPRPRGPDGSDLRRHRVAAGEGLQPLARTAAQLGSRGGCRRAGGGVQHSDRGGHVHPRGDPGGHGCEAPGIDRDRGRDRVGRRAVAAGRARPLQRSTVPAERARRAAVLHPARDRLRCRRRGLQRLAAEAAGVVPRSSGTCRRGLPPARAGSAWAC